MTIVYTIRAVCTNKLCDYQETATLINERHLREKRVCPKCGFKTLDEAPITTNAEFSAAMRAALKGSVKEITNG